MASQQPYNLIADIGGTNARFALVHPYSQAPIAAKTLRCSEYESLTDALNAYLSSIPFERPTRASLAVACPVVSEDISMTNLPWRFNLRDLQQQLKMHSVKMLNDFTALALAVPYLSKEHFHRVGGGEPSTANAPKAIIGPGTGLGVSGLVYHDGNWYPLQGEGGHGVYGPVTEVESWVLEYIRTHIPCITAETLLSGQGLITLYKSLVQIDKQMPQVITPAQVTRLAIDGTDEYAEKALNMFCEILGSVAGNVALTLGARGGVYIGGGIVPRILDFFLNSGFRCRFEGEGKMQSYLKQIQTRVIVERYPALVGAAVAFDEKYQSVGVTVEV